MCRPAGLAVRLSQHRGLGQLAAVLLAVEDILVSGLLRPGKDLHRLDVRVLLVVAGDGIDAAYPEYAPPQPLHLLAQCGPQTRARTGSAAGWQDMST